MLVPLLLFHQLTALAADEGFFPSSRARWPVRTPWLHFGQTGERWKRESGLLLNECRALARFAEGRGVPFDEIDLFHHHPVFLGEDLQDLSRFSFFLAAMTCTTSFLRT